MITLVKEVAAFVRENLAGCRFVGISGEQEVFLEFDHEDAALELASINKLKEAFPQITQTTIVVRPSISELKEMVEGLNKLLEEPAPPKNLLDIKGF